MTAQIIGMDIGRGFVKAYSQYGGKMVTKTFPSFIATGMSQDSWEDEDIFVSVEGIVDEEGYPIRVNNRFVGERARMADGIGYTSDSKSDEIVQTLFATMLSKVAVSEYVKVMLGVPDDLATKATLEKVQKTFKGKTYKIIDHIAGTSKEVLVEDVYIYREGNSVGNVLKTVDDDLANHDIAIVTTGYKTTELSYYNKGFKYNRDLSGSFPLGNIDVLDKTVLALKNGAWDNERVVTSPYHVDTDNRYFKFATPYYKELSENIKSVIENKWRNRKLAKCFVAGGTSTKEGYRLFGEFEHLPNPQIITAKGLYIAGEAYFAKKVA